MLLSFRYYLGDHLRVSRATQLFWTVNEVVALLRGSYCGTTTVEHEHVVSKAAKDWICLMVERPQARSLFLPSFQRRILYHLLYAGISQPSHVFAWLFVWFVVCEQNGHFSNSRTSDLILVDTDHFERFLATKFQASKRFGLEGCESLIPGLFALIEVCSWYQFPVNAIFPIISAEQEEWTFHWKKRAYWKPMCSALHIFVFREWVCGMGYDVISILKWAEWNDAACSRKRD